MINEQKTNASDMGSERRRAERATLNDEICVNSGLPYRGGVIHDISTTGIAISYPVDKVAVDRPLEVDETVKLILAGVAAVDCRVARMFDGGFAVQFNKAMNISAVIR